MRKSETSGCLELSGKILPDRTRHFGHPEKFCSRCGQDKLGVRNCHNTADDKIIPYITNICKRDPRTGNVVTGGIVSCQDSSWLLELDH